MTTLCALTGCGRPTHNALICVHHLWQLERDLADVPALLADLEVTLSRQSVTGPVSERPSGGETPLAFHHLASEAAEGLRDTVIGWARDLGMPWAEYATTASMHLLRILPNLHTHGDLPDLADQVADACHRARTATDLPADRTRFPVGPCPETTSSDGGWCPGTVIAHIPADNRPATMRCTADPTHRWTSVQWLRTGRRILTRLAQQKRSA